MGDPNASASLVKVLQNAKETGRLRADVVAALGKTVTKNANVHNALLAAATDPNEQVGPRLGRKNSDAPEGNAVTKPLSFQAAGQTSSDVRTWVLRKAKKNGTTPTRQDLNAVDRYNQCASFLGRSGY